LQITKRKQQPKQLALTGVENELINMHGKGLPKKAYRDGGSQTKQDARRKSQQRDVLVCVDGDRVPVKMKFLNVFKR
jgi:hypothetical protein